MIIIDGTMSPMGRVASFAAKKALQGEEIKVVNCNKIIITGNKKTTKREFQERRSRHGSSQKGPILNKSSSEKIVKRAIRGMLPDHREGRGRDAFKRIRCYNEVPTEFIETEKVIIEKGMKKKFGYVKEFTRQ